MPKKSISILFFAAITLFAACKKDVSTTPEKPATFVAPKDTTPLVDTTLQVTIYPNPTSGPFTIQTNDNNSHTIQIIDMLGALKFKEVVSGETTVIDFLGLQQGVYFVKVTGWSQTITRKIIVIN